MKKTLLALLVAGAAAQSQAAIQLGSPAGQNNVSGSELVLVAYDSVALTTYVRDLGVTFSQFQAGANATTNFGVGSQWASAFGSSNASNITWLVAATDNADFGTGETAATRGTRMITTYSGAAPSYGTSTLANSAAVFNTYLQAANSYGNNGSVANGEAFGTAATVSNIDAIGQSALSLMGFNNASAALGTSMYSGLFAATNGADGTDGGYWEPQDGVAFSGFQGLWSLAANGSLSYTVPSVATPVPAAVWLLGSGLVGLVGVSRRRDTQV